MKKYLVIIMVLALGACRTGTPSSVGPMGPSGNLTGASTSRAAVELFLQAAKAQDLQTMSAIWGGTNGAARDMLPRDQLEKREVIMQCYLAHDSFRIVSDAHRNGKELYQVSLTKGPVTRQTTVSAVQGPSSRWYVSDVSLEPLSDVCRESSKR